LKPKQSLKEMIIIIEAKTERKSEEKTLILKIRPE